MKRWGALAFVGLGCFGAACGPCNPPPPGQDIEIRNGTFPPWWGSNIAQTNNYAWERQDLSIVPGLALGNQPADVPLNAVYRSIGETFAAAFNTQGVGQPPTVFRRRPELHLFARDPRELYFTLTRSTPLVGWPAQMSTPTNVGVNTPPFAVPADMVVPYGTNVIADIYPNQITSNIAWQNFWRNENGVVLSQSDWVTSGSACSGTFGCPASDPDGFGSVKALRSIELPECSSALKIQTALFAPFQSILHSSLECSTNTLPTSPPLPCGFGTYTISPTLVSLNAMSYLNHVEPKLLAQQPVNIIALDQQRPTPESGAVSGVLVAGQIHVEGTTDNTCGFDWEPCDVEFLYDLQFTLDANGYFAVAPHRITLRATNGTLCNGAGAFFGGLKSVVQQLFEADVPGNVHQVAKDKQKIPAPDVPPLCKADKQSCSSNFDCCSRLCSAGSCAASQLLPWSCPYDVAGASFGYDVASACHGAILELGIAVSAGGAALAIDSSAVARLSAIVEDVANWRCRRPTADEVISQCSQNKQIRGKCEFRVPAEFTVPEPDEVRIGFSELDNFVTASTVPNPSDSHEFQSSVAFLAAYFAAGLQGVQSNLCTPPMDANSAGFYNRYFATLSIGTQRCVQPQPACRGDRTACGANTDCCSGICALSPIQHATFCAPLPRLTCGCSNDSDCANGDKCSAGRCQQVCRANSDCASQFCYQDIHLCQSPPTGQSCAQFPGVCFPWELCDPQYGNCFERKQPEGYPD